MSRRGQDAYWRAILALDVEGPWNVLAVDNRRFDDAGRWRSYASRKADQATIREYVGRLVKAGIAEPAGSLPPLVPLAKPSPLYRLRERPVASPRLRPDGSPLPEKQTETLWRTLKMMRVVTARELAAHAATDERPVKRGVAMRYLSELRRVGVVQCVSKGGPGVEARYRFVMNLGALPPMIRHGTHEVYDPNSRTVLEPCSCQPVR